MPKGGRGGQRSPTAQQSNVQQQNNTSNNAVRSVQDCVNDLQKIGIRVDQSLLKSATDQEILGITESIEYLVSEFPQVRGIPDGSGSGKTRDAIKTLKSATMKAGVEANASFAGEITFNSKYLRTKGAKRGVASHETGHLLERALILKNTKGKLAAAAAWNKCTYATKVLHEACNNLKSQPAFKGMTNDQLIGKVSNYALTNRSEALAECVKDYAKKKGNAKPVSIEVWKILKRELG